MKKNYLNLNNPLRLFVFICLAIFFVEFCIMLVLEYIIAIPGPLENFIDSLSLILIIYPILYFFIFKPLIVQNVELDKIKSLFETEKVKAEAMLESVGEGLIAIDNNKKILLINKPASEMLNWKMKDLVGSKINELPLEDENGNPIPSDKRPAATALEIGDVVRATYFFVRKDKTKFPIAITATPIKLNGKIIGLIEIIRDVTKEKEVDRAKTEFVSVASHQLRTPLTAINWYLEMILNGDVGKISADQKKYLEEINKGNKRMIELVNTLLNVSRLEMGTFIAEPEPVQLKEVAESVLVELEPQIVAQHLIVEKSYDSSLPVIFVDSKLIRMIFQNILGNAVKYVSNEGKIILDISVQKSDVLIKVWNNGMEIPKEAQSKIFTKLFRDNLAKQKDPDGNGLGLYIVKSIVEKSGGKIWFESGDEKGTTFFVTLPLVINK